MCIMYIELMYIELLSLDLWRFNRKFFDFLRSISGRSPEISCYLFLEFSRNSINLKESISM